jgi:hypothetical protein
LGAHWLQKQQQRMEIALQQQQLEEVSCLMGWTMVMSAPLCEVECGQHLHLPQSAIFIHHLIHEVSVHVITLIRH